MKKFFQFSGTINGTTYLLRMLFSIVLSIPALIIIFAFFGVFAIEYAEIDMQNPEGFDQQALDYINYNFLNSSGLVWFSILL